MWTARMWTAGMWTRAVPAGPGPAERHFEALKRVLLRRGEGDFAT